MAVRCFWSNKWREQGGVGKHIWKVQENKNLVFKDVEFEMPIRHPSEMLRQEVIQLRDSSGEGID